MNTSTPSFEKERGVSDVRIEAEVAHYVVSLPSDQLTPDKHLSIYKGLSSAGIPLRLVKLHPGGVSFSVETDRRSAVEETLNRLGYPFQNLGDMVIVAITSANMREMFGVMATLAETLLVNKVDIAQLGDSHDAVLCLVPSSQRDVALAALRKAFLKTEAPA